MRTLRDEAVRKEIVTRLQNLTPTTKPKWGRLDAHHALCHLSDTFAMSLGEVAVRSMNRKAFQLFPLKHLILYVLPFPKGAPTPPELVATVPGNFDADRQRVLEQINRLAAAPNGKGPAHPFFGPLTNDEWNALQWKHIEHHLKQFGC
jgi:hypothetical protein